MSPHEADRVRELLPSVSCNRSIAAVIGCDVRDVQRIRHGSPLIPAPADFAAVAPTMTRSQIERHYGRSNSTVARWLQETGVEAKPYDPLSSPNLFRRGHQHHLAAKQRSGAVAHTTRKLKVAPPRLNGTEDRAADHLRRFASVYRCDETGRMTERGTRWRYGNAILAPDELIARAQRHGFDPDGWARL